MSKLSSRYTFQEAPKLLNKASKLRRIFIFLVKPELTIDYLGICFGLCALVMGAIKLNLALDHYHLGNSNPGWYVLDGIIRISFAIFLIFNPIGGISVWIMLVGAYFIISAIDVFIASILIEKLFNN